MKTTQLSEKKSDRGLSIKSDTVQQLLQSVITRAHSSPGMHCCVIHYCRCQQHDVAGTTSTAYEDLLVEFK